MRGVPRLCSRDPCPWRVFVCIKGGFLIPGSGSAAFGLGSPPLLAHVLLGHFFFLSVVFYFYRLAMAITIDAD